MEQQTTMPNKKRWYRRKIFYIILIAGLIISSIVYTQVKKANKGIEYETTTVVRGTLSQTVDATGNVTSANELDLRLESGGRVAVIYKQTNAQVKKGEIILDLELGELNARVGQASAAVSRAQANLDKVLAGQTDSYVAGLNAKLDQAKANLEQIKAVSSDTIANAEAALATAEQNLKLSQGGENSEIVRDAYDDMVALLLSVQTSMADALTASDNILGIDNTLANDDYESVLSALNLSKLSTAKNRFYNAKTKKLELDSLANDLSLISTPESISVAASSAQMALLDMKDLLFAMSDVLDSTVPIGELSQTELDTLKTSIATQRASINSDYTTLVNQLQAISAASTSYETNLVALTKATTNLENTKLKANADIAAYQSLVDQAQAQYDDATNPPREEDVRSARAQVYEAQATLAQVAAARNKSRIIAPVDGTIGKVDAKVGEYVSPQDVVVKMVSPHFEVKVDIPETDIPKISLNNSADITLDAFGDDVHFTGVVTLIERGETVIQDVVYYTVTVSLDGDESHDILNGMTANVVFNTEQKENVLYVFQRVIRTQDSKKLVRILENKEVREVEVTTGLRGDNGLVEVISGLEEGQEVVIREITE